MARRTIPGAELSPYTPDLGHLSGKVTVYDTTLRDGEQIAGVVFRPEDKIAIARRLVEIGVPQVEVGFPAVSRQERATVRAIAGLGLDADILVLSRTLREDIDAAVDSGADVALLFVGASDLHLRHKLRKSADEVVGLVADAMAYAHERGIRATFTPEDSTRTAWPVLERLFRSAIDGGAERVGFADTVGVATPEGIGDLVARLQTMTALPISVHLHNDFGLALANAIAAVQRGATAVNTTVAGLGERCGNVPLETFVGAMQVLYGVDLGIDLAGLHALTELVADRARFPIPPNAPLVGSNAFAHESGIHVAAIAEDPRTYEAIPPETVGNRRRVLLGKQSGRGSVRWFLAQRGMAATEEQVDRIVGLVKGRGARDGSVAESTFWEVVGTVLGTEAAARP